MKTIILFFALAAIASAQVKVSDLPAASALGGTEVFPTVQSATTKKATTAQIAEYARSVAAATLAPKASPTFTGTVTIPSGASIADYLSTATAASTYQPLDSGLTAFAGLTDAAGVLANNGSGTLFYQGTSTGTNGATDSGKLVVFQSNGSINATTRLRAYSSSNYTEMNILGLANTNGTWTQAFRWHGTPTANRVVTLPDATGTVALESGPLGTPSSATLTNATGLPIATGVSGLGTGIATALAVNVGSAGAPTLFNGAGGTPSSITLTNATGLPIGSGISGLGTGIATALAVNVGTAGAPVVNGGALGTPSSGTGTNITGIPPANITGTAATLGANTFTALQTITQGTANTGIIASTGYSLNGNNATSMIDLSGTWNTTGTPTAVKINITDTASNADSLFLDLQAGGVSRYKLKKNGDIYTRTGVLISEFAFQFRPYGVTMLNLDPGIGGALMTGTYGILVADTTAYIGFYNGGTGQTNARIYGGGTGQIEVRNSTTAQTLRIYDTYTDSSNYERTAIQSGSGYIEFAAETAGTGADDLDVRITPAGTGGVLIGIGSTAIKNVLSAVATMDFNLTGVIVEDLTMAVTGAAVGDVVQLGVPHGSVTATAQYTAWVSATDTVTIRCRTAIAGENPASGSFRVTVTKH